MANWGNLLRQAAKIGMDLLSRSQTPTRPAGGTAAPRLRTQARSAPTGDAPRTIAYAPDLDGSADPGEIVWAWVPFEENDGRGKDRPLLVVGRQEGDLVGLMLSSQHERADDRDWVSIGSGAWDREGRESFVRLDRVLEVGEHDIRREGAVLDRDRFDRVAGELRGRFGWS
ncbi:type II toxin-antitoxin system PemK/MazF family toxin [Pseudonocardia abyssalis]|uniref:Type II toxin-antitoxin system PemK/MazF family toxin n=1 Tax=Pseudonocardia abyssalis TaxID=2792008 RepID=A0ABS6UMG7_9PSEU|nr:type II toxin-antitoxin system PemK/MazF family toxin [Pseudonocardia abyssalis]MBW0118796.1 type II toxin-antitoxin system PemK/MazF family toxin [Pseudonocardia abyssalis]MBW0133440.1 type II toxin-antitoxin system PemK/MazF family toxin [Pseudonocardia abyssalis]